MPYDRNASPSTGSCCHLGKRFVWRAGDDHDPPHAEFRSPRGVRERIRFCPATSRRSLTRSFTLLNAGVFLFCALWLGWAERKLCSGGGFFAVAWGVRAWRRLVCFSSPYVALARFGYWHLRGSRWDIHSHVGKPSATSPGGPDKKLHLSFPRIYINVEADVMHPKPG